MAHEATTWAYKLTGLKVSRKSVLVALADMADEEFSCYPGQAKIAAMAGLHVATVKRVLADLELMGLIVRERRNTSQGYRTSDRYVLQVGAEVIPISVPETVEDADESLGRDLPTAQAALVATSEGLGRIQSKPKSQSALAKVNSQYESPEELSSSETAVTEIVRTDVEDLCSLLRDSILSNGVRKTQAVVTDGWRDSARLLLDRDRVPLAEARRVLLWSQSDGFWQKNILSMPKFREKYDQLSLKSRGAPGSSTLDRNLQRLAEMRAQEVAS